MTHSPIAADRLRTATQQPLSSPKFCILYLKAGEEKQSPWLYQRAHADRALQILRNKFGARNAVIYID